MLALDASPETRSWFGAMLSHQSPSVRRAALRLLAKVLVPQRDRWLLAALDDSDPQVAAVAVRALDAPVDAEGELLEADFAGGHLGDDLEWEWEWVIAVAHGACVPVPEIVVWTRMDDDTVARELAVMKAYVGKESESAVAVPILVSKRLVNLYTRRARSQSETARWEREGRPRYRE